MTCPKCENRNASGMYCQRCGWGLMIAKIEAPAQKPLTLDDLDAAVADANRSSRLKYEAMLEDNSEKDAQAYLQLAQAHDELKAELSKVTSELTSASTGTTASVVPPPTA